MFLGDWKVKFYRYTFKNGWSCFAPTVDLAVEAFKTEHGFYGIVCGREER